jgi:hypothetical protein
VSCSRRLRGSLFFLGRHCPKSKTLQLPQHILHLRLINFARCFYDELSSVGRNFCKQARVTVNAPRDDGTTAVSINR